MIKFVAKYQVKGVENYATIDECANYLYTLPVIGIDIETSVNEEYRHLQNPVYKGGLDPYLSKIVMLQLGTVDLQYVIDVRDYTNEELAPILSILDYNPEIILVGHNLKFEAKHLKQKFGINFHTIWDTMLMEITLYNGLNLPLGLADLAGRYLGVEKAKELSLFETTFQSSIVTLDDELVSEAGYITPFDVEDAAQIDKSTRLQFIDIASKPFTEKQILYGADDIIYPILIRERQLVGRRLSDGIIHNPTKWQKIENHYCLALADLELNGMYVDTKMWTDLHDANYIIYKEREEKLTNYIIKNYPQYSAGTLDLFSGKQECIIQWTSSTQLVKLFKSLDMCPKAYSKQTKRVEYTVGATELTRTLPNSLKVLYERNKDIEIVDLETFKLGYLLFKKAEQSVTTFGKAWLKYIHPLTGRAHSNYKQILNTTRISSTSPNLNNISGGAWRNTFKAPPGKVLVNLDYSAQEVKMASSKSKDEALINFFVVGDERFGDDFHAYTATKVYQILENNPSLFVPPKEILVEGVITKNPLFTEQDGRRRTDSKSITFGLLFGKSVYTFAMDLGITLEEADELLKSYFNAFPGLKEHFKRCEKRADGDYIIIDDFSGAAWFCPFFTEIQSTYKEAWSYFPEDYNRLSKKDRESAKKIVYEEYPFVKGLFQKAGRLKNGLINKNKNYIIQGACSQIMKIAMNILRKNIIEQNLTHKVIANVYDECVLEVEEEEGEGAGILAKTCMERAGTIIDPVIPQIANFVLQKSWGH